MFIARLNINITNARRNICLRISLFAVSKRFFEYRNRFAIDGLSLYIYFSKFNQQLFMTFRVTNDVQFINFMLTYCTDLGNLAITLHSPPNNQIEPLYNIKCV